MAATKTNSAERQTPTQLREENKRLKEGAWCYLCDTHKPKRDFYKSTDGHSRSGLAPICKKCAEKIALREDANGFLHEPTKESIIEALKYLNKPFLNTVWDASVTEASDTKSGKVKSNVWNAYIKNVSMQNYNGKTFFDSDLFKGEPIPYADEISAEDVLEAHSGQDTYDSFEKNKEDVIRLLDYDPFDKEAVSDQPFLYAQLLGILDSSEDANSDMIRTSSAISIARNFLQIAKIDDTVADLMKDARQLQTNTPMIKNLQESKQKIVSTIKDLAAESCLSLRNNKNSIKGENTWTGKIKRIRDLNLRNSAVNGFDIMTCRGMQQVQEISDKSIFKQLQLDESEWSDMVADMRVQNSELRKERDQYKEINRILLRENIDLKDYMEEKGIVPDVHMENLKEIYSVFSDDEESLPEEGDGDEQTLTSE